MLTSPPIPLLFVAMLAIWRITHLFWAEDGPGDIFARLRRIAGPGFFGKLLDCFYCLSLWIALPFAGLIGRTWLERVVLWFALSGGAILLERVTSRNPPAPPPARWEEQPLPPQEKHENQEELEYAMLR